MLPHNNAICVFDNPVNNQFQLNVKCSTWIHSRHTKNLKPGQCGSLIRNKESHKTSQEIHICLQVGWKVRWADSLITDNRVSSELEVNIPPSVTIEGRGRELWFLSKMLTMTPLSKRNGRLLPQEKYDCKFLFLPFIKVVKRRFSYLYGTMLGSL